MSFSKTFFHAIVLCSLGFSFFIPAGAFASVNYAPFSGVVASVTPCFGSMRSLISFAGAQTPTLIYDSALSNAIDATGSPRFGDAVFGLSGDKETCLTLLPFNQVQLPAITFYAATGASNLPSVLQNNGSGYTTGTQYGSGAPSSSFSFLFSFVSNLLSGVSGGTSGSPSSLNPGGGPGSPSSTGGSGNMPFGGMVLSPPIPCDSPPGAYEVILGPPTPGNYMWTPMTQTYLYGPPLAAGQWTLGLYIPGVCVIGPTAHPVLTMTMEGASAGGAAKPPPPKPVPPPPSNSCTQYDTSTAAGKAQAEAAVRKQLSSEGVTVKKGACAVGGSFRTTAGGCTDVSGLQCSSLTDLQSLATQCGSFQITGGSEEGHATHDAGNAVDVSNSASFNSCVENSFTQTHCSKYGGDPVCWLDQKTGTTYWQEGGGVPGSTASHWHICFGGKGC